MSECDSCISPRRKRSFCEDEDSLQEFEQPQEDESEFVDDSETESYGNGEKRKAKKMRKVPLSDEEAEKKRVLANSQERERMNRLNRALSNLRKVLPPEYSVYNRRLSKIRTLKVAINYIKGLTEMLQEDYCPTEAYPALQQLQQHQQRQQQQQQLLYPAYPHQQFTSPAFLNSPHFTGGGTPTDEGYFSSFNESPSQHGSGAPRYEPFHGSYLSTPLPHQTTHHPAMTTPHRGVGAPHHFLGTPQSVHPGWAVPVGLTPPAGVMPTPEMTPSSGTAPPSPFPSFSGVIPSCGMASLSPVTPLSPFSPDEGLGRSVSSFLSPASGPFQLQRRWSSTAAPGSSSSEHVSVTGKDQPQSLSTTQTFLDDMDDGDKQTVLQKDGMGIMSPAYAQQPAVAGPGGHSTPIVADPKWPPYFDQDVTPL